MDEQSRITPQKPNRRSPYAGFLGGRGFQRHLLSRSSVRAEVRDEKNQKAADLWFSWEWLRKMGSGLTKDKIYGC